MPPPALVLTIAPLLAVPAWVWAALVMAGFVGLTVLTMVLIRVPIERRPPPIAPPPGGKAEASSREEAAGPEAEG